MDSMAIFLFVALICACIILGHLLEKNIWIKESIVALILGCAAGFIVALKNGGTNHHLLEFDEELFFIYLLPPIIFNAGFQVKKKQFFRNFTTIILYGVLGTFISFVVVALGSRFIFPMLGIENLSLGDYFALGAIFSATDSVCTLQVLNQNETPLLYSLVFGEGVVNDATSVVLFRTLKKLTYSGMNAMTILHVFSNFFYLFMTSTALGLATGLVSAYITKTLYFGRHSTDREIAIMSMMAYFSYLLAEILHLSGILAVFFCGIVMSHYAWHNVTKSSQVTTKHAFATMSFIAETFIFLYVGMDAFDAKKRMTNYITAYKTSGVLFMLILAGRATFVFSLSAISNVLLRRSKTRITGRQQFVIWWAGLIRGAVSMALAYNQFTPSGSTLIPEYSSVISSTILLVLFSTLAFGIVTKPLICWVLPDNIYDPESSYEDLHMPFLQSEDLKSLQSEDLKRSARANFWAYIGLLSNIDMYWRQFDDSYMRPIFGGRGFAQV